MRTRDEIMIDFIKNLTAAGEYNKPFGMSEEEYGEFQKGIFGTSGESEWKPGRHEPLQPEWVKQWQSIPGGQTGESEWAPTEPDQPQDLGYKYNPEEKVYRGRRHPERPAPQRKRIKQKLEQPNARYSDEEFFNMAKKEPAHVVTNLMLQRKAPYNQFKYVYPLTKSLLDWMIETGISPEKGTMLYEEAQHMLDIIEQEANKREEKK